MRISPLFVYVAAVFSLDPLDHSAFTPRHLRQLRARTQVLFQHGWNAYITHGFPADEVRPVSCVPYGPQYTFKDDINNDVLGNVSSTVLDNLDTLIIMKEWEQLENMLQFLKTNQYGFFNQDQTIQVFEASIRWLGGLLSAHLALSEIPWTEKDGKFAEIAQNYDGFLLNMAYDLGLRLIPVYNTSTRLPIPRINLAKGANSTPLKSNRDACTAGATTPFLEFSLLSRLTGDDRFETLTRKTVDKLWAARSDLGLLPMSLDAMGNKWMDEFTGIGASIDSFFEYALKGSILFDDNHLWDMFSKSYQSLVALSAVKLAPHSWMYFANIHTSTASRYTSWIDSLSAFWPGVQVLAGRLSDAVSTHLVYLKIWDYFDGIPERWDPISQGTDILSNQERVERAITLEWYPLRPEFIESTYYLYRATKDPLYLQIGVRVLSLFETRYKAKCGFRGYQDVRTGQMQDRMETFVLGESLKYLYLLFDEANESYVHKSYMEKTNWVFSTEAHPLWLSRDIEEKNQKYFQRFLSFESIEHTTFKEKGLFGSMWRGLIQPSNELGPLTESGEIDEIDYTRLGPGFRPAFAFLDSCETKPQQLTRSEKFLSSGFYEWDQLFTPNHVMHQTLVRPSHMEDLSENVIELSKGFLETYGLFATRKCALSSTNIETEYQIGGLRRPEQFEMYEVTEENVKFPFKRHDIVMPQLSGRFRTEHLTSDVIDGYGTIITKQDLDNIRSNLDASLTDNTKSVLRVRFLNGIDILPETTVWSEASYLGSNPDVFTISASGQVHLMGQYVMNMRAY